VGDQLLIKVRFCGGNYYFDVPNWEAGHFLKNNTLEEASYDNGKMEARLGDNSLETIRGARGARAAF
jgi:hypothetical protein